jgi:hypothetical protein
MRKMRFLGIFLTAVFVLLCGCGNNSSNPPASLSYSTSTAVYIKNVAVTVDYPTISSGTVSAYTVNPALPAGLSLNPSTGMITGTPRLWPRRAVIPLPPGTREAAPPRPCRLQ